MFDNRRSFLALATIFLLVAKYGAALAGSERKTTVYVKSYTAMKEYGAGMTGSPFMAVVPLDHFALKSSGRKAVKVPSQ